MDISEDLLCHLTTFLPWKTLITYCSTNKLLWIWYKTKTQIIENSIFVTSGAILQRYWNLVGYDSSKRYLDTLKIIFSRNINRPYNYKTVAIKQLYRNYYFMNPILNEEFKVWSPLFNTRNVEKTRDNYIVSIGSKQEQSETIQTWRKLIQQMTILMYRNIKHSSSIRVVSCPYRNWDTTPPTPMAALERVKVYANIYKHGIGKRKRVEVPKNHIPTRYWHSRNQFTQSFHALQCMNVKKGNRARVLVSFKIFRSPDKSYEWFLKCQFHKIDIYCY